MGKLFNGITFTTKFATPASGETAAVERKNDASYEVQITFTAKIPRPSLSLDDLARNDPKLPEVLNQMSALIGSASVSPYFDTLYKNKINSIRSDLFALNEVLSRHNFYDCDTILELKGQQTGRKALLIVGDMDANVDGSDGDRNVQVDDSGRFFQPQTSYRWPRLTGRENPFLSKTQDRLDKLKAEYATPGLSAQRNQELRDAIQHATRTINDIKSYSFLISSTDPSIVVPGFMLRDSSNGWSPSIGDYAAVIYNGVIYPAIVGDAGPSAKVGEASLRLCREINPKSSGNSRPVSDIKVAYLIFPGTAESATQPDLEKWRAKCKQYLDEIGGTAPEIFTWQNIVPPWPTPTPTPTPSPEATGSPLASPSPSEPEVQTSPPAAVVTPESTP